MPVSRSDYTGVLSVDFSGAMRKTKMMMSIPASARKRLKDWAAVTVKELRLSAREKHMKGRGPNKVSGHLWRNIGMEVEVTQNAYKVGVGTGVAGKANVKYAWIQNFGGTTHPTVTARMKRYMWWRHYKEFGREVRGMGLRGAERKGALATWGNHSIYKAIALMRLGTKLNVKIPASHWFTEVIDRRKPLLGPVLDAAAIWRECEALAGMGTDYDVGGD